MSYDHLRFSREITLTDRYRRRSFGGPRPEDPRAHGETLRLSLRSARSAAQQYDISGYDDRLLIKIQLREGVSVPELNAIPGVEIVSQEDKSVILAFADHAGLGEFESRLSSLAVDGRTTRADLLYALQSFDHWTPLDRTGAALRHYGYPDSDTFILDVELWPQERSDKRNAMLSSFLATILQAGLERLDDLKQPSLVMVRLRCNRQQAENILLCHRDVRTVDLPPRHGVAIELLYTDINEVPAPPVPPANAPGIAVLDTGLNTGHPVLASAVGDAQGYVAPHREAYDEGPHWHGTFVGGLATYGNFAECLRSRQFIPQLRLFSGKVFTNNGDDQTEFVEKAVEEAVRDLHTQYGCKVFNLSYGDLNKVYDGRHVRGLAYTLDRLTRELGVLFVVPTGNLGILEDLPTDPLSIYPNYLLESNARLIDPAPALNALTVGGLSLNVASHSARQYPNTIEERPIAQEFQPFPLTRCGPSVNGAIKPDVVEHAGNLAIMRGTDRAHHAGMGIISAGGDFTGGRPFVEDIGTSYAAPQVAHRAALLLRELPAASANLLRALIAAHARWPLACKELFNEANSAEGKARLLQVIGYGCVDDNALFRSLEQIVTLVAEDRIQNDKCHFFELPIPDSFWSRGNRLREITVSFCYSPDIRTTRLDYRMSKLWYTLVVAPDLNTVAQSFRRNREEGLGERSTGRWISNTARKSSTLQLSRWVFKRPIDHGERLFVVVTRQDSPWGSVADQEEFYALVAVIDDRENSANLYAQVRSQLEARIQERARARI